MGTFLKLPNGRKRNVPKLPKLPNYQKERRRYIINLAQKILQLIYPPTCSICKAPSQEYLCKKCQKKLNQIELLSQENAINNYFDECIHGFIYEGIIRKLILQYKFEHKPYIYRTFINFFKKNEKLYLLFKKYDIIVPVPISKNRYKFRGYNQSSLLAKEFAGIFDLDFEGNILIKIKNNPKQSTLSQEERFLNTQGVYKINKNAKIINKNILLLDDVFTTGATCNECAKVLKEAGAGKVGVFTIAKD